MFVSRMPTLSEASNKCNAISLRRVLIFSALLGACGGQSKAGFDFDSAISQQKSVNDAGLTHDAGVPTATSMPTLQSSPSATSSAVPSSQPKKAVKPCPPEMVNVNGKFCIDRYEARLIDTKKGRVLSPYYSPTRSSALVSYNGWRHRFWKYGTPLGKRTRPPKLPDWQRKEKYTYKASSVANVVPHGYLNALEAKKACKNAKKRLCQVKEWRTACKGEKKTRYPYGNTFKYGKCNYGRFPHPAQQLHGKKAEDYKLWDPRLNMIKARGEEYLHNTGDKKECVSRFGKDGASDMVGNLDEWALDGKKPVMLGGTYMRGRTKQGCNARIGAHAPIYSDYSIGTRCCTKIQK